MLVLGILGVARIAELLVDLLRRRRPVRREALHQALEVRDAEVVHVGRELLRSEGLGRQRHVAAIAAAHHHHLVVGHAGVADQPPLAGDHVLQRTAAEVVAVQPRP